VRARKHCVQEGEKGEGQREQAEKERMVNTNTGRNGEPSKRSKTEYGKSPHVHAQHGSVPYLVLLPDSNGIHPLVPIPTHDVAQVLQPLDLLALPAHLASTGDAHVLLRVLRNGFTLERKRREGGRKRGVSKNKYTSNPSYLVSISLPPSLPPSFFHLPPPA